jgi:hypothetical protein
MIMNFRAVIAILSLSTACFSLPARADNCQEHFKPKSTYGTWHQGPTLAFSGKIKITKTSITTMTISIQPQDFGLDPILNLKDMLMLPTILRFGAGNVCQILSEAIGI